MTQAIYYHALPLQQLDMHNDKPPHPQDQIDTQRTTCGPGFFHFFSLANREAGNRRGSRSTSTRQPPGSLVPSRGPHGVHPIGDAGGSGVALVQVPW